MLLGLGLGIGTSLGRTMVVCCFPHIPELQDFKECTWFILGLGMESADTTNLGCPVLAEAQMCNRCSLCFLEMNLNEFPFFMVLRAQ